MQLADLQRQVQTLPPSVVQEQTRLFDSLSAEQKRQIADKAKDMDPAMLSRATGQLPAAALLRDAEDLKKEGNRLHGLGDYSAAIQKYCTSVDRIHAAGSVRSKPRLGCRVRCAALTC